MVAEVTGVVVITVVLLMVLMEVAAEQALRTRKELSVSGAPGPGRVCNDQDSGSDG